ncbi:related to poly(3-hydroxybutyrate) depolymerase [Rhynchosporium secalis]|uniref:feruloyl esterase n=1 Tax=Rhynchosporium secalis TaxID=38038 RepID=A0A1E1MSN7_RHYSE|nr:related to poly(3-hydroxybutyrate) depolymerase [Rhynchosporium secalis]
MALISLLLLASLSLITALPSSSDSPTKSCGCGKALPVAQRPAGGDSHRVQFKQSDGTAPSSQEELSQFSNEEWNPNALAVYPQGIDNQWQGDPASKGVDDIGFVSDMIKHFTQRYCVDTSRIYAAGKSNGGGFTNTLACDPQLSKQIAAFAPVSGAFYVPGSTSTSCSAQTISIPCNPGRHPLPMLEFHGSDDTTIPYSGGARRGVCLPTVPHWVREWSKREGHGLTNQTTGLYGGRVLKYEYGGAAGKLGIVTHYLVDGLGHDWPSQGPNGDSDEGTYLDATPLIMDFFARYRL